MSITDKIVPDYNKLALPFKKQVGGHVLVDNKHIADTMKCGHCYAQWVYIKGSGRVRGYCQKCNQITCGKYQCNFCISDEDRLIAVEKGETLEQAIKRVDSKPKIFIK